MNRKARYPELIERNRAWFEEHARTQTVPKKIAAFLLCRSGTYVGMLARGMGLSKAINLDVPKMRKWLRDHPDFSSTPKVRSSRPSHPA